MAEFKYGIRDKLAFYASYFWYKLILPVEVKSPRFALWCYELAYTAHKFFDYEYCLPWNGKSSVISTRFGAFRIRRGTANAANVSPAFERRDLNHLFKLIDALVDSGKRVIFLDVGGDIGTYSIAVGTRYDSQPVDVVCFEPIPASCGLIVDNIERNQLTNRVELIEVALMDEAQDSLKINLNTLAPGSSSIKGEGEEVFVKADRLDKLMADRITDMDAMVLKVDVEGVEENVLRGAAGLLMTGIETHLMVEDFIDRSIVDYLERENWSFEGKRTEYNSWWRKN
jgi:FkbM family methyltransferase